MALPRMPLRNKQPTGLWPYQGNRWEISNLYKQQVPVEWFSTGIFVIACSAWASANGCKSREKGYLRVKSSYLMCMIHLASKAGVPYIFTVQPKAGRSENIYYFAK